MDFFSRQWLNHCRGEFPRKIGFVKDPSPRRKKEIVETADEFLHEMWTHVADLDLYVAIFSERQKQEKRFDTVFLDLDDEVNLDKAHEDMQKIAKSMFDYCQILPRTYFSGGKGFHIFLDFIELPFDYYKEVVYEWIERLDKELGLLTVDYSVVGDIERVSALPYSNHTGTNMIRTPINALWPLDHILKVASSESTIQIPICIPRLHAVENDIMEWDEDYEPPEPLPALDIDGQNGSSDLDYILQHASKFKGVKRIFWTKVIPIYKAKRHSRSELLQYCKKICELANRRWTSTLEHWVVSNYICDKGIPWSWSALFNKWREMRSWFK